MDWIGHKLSALIAEGQKALGAHIVVASQAKEDETDDGSGAWVDEDEFAPKPTGRGRSGSVRSTISQRAYNVPLPASPPASPRRSGFGSPRPSFSSGSVPAPRPLKADSSFSSVTSNISVHKEDESSWESPELKAMMEAARLRRLQQLSS